MKPIILHFIKPLTIWLQFVFYEIDILNAS
jgi:hypothetical protein